MVDVDLTTEEVAAALRLHRATVQRLLKSGRLKGYQVGRSWRVPRTALEEFRQRDLPSAGGLLPLGAGLEALAMMEGYDQWERMLLSEEDLAAAPPIPAEALRREKMYEERD
jgi:excisionase family DNA binding protein